MPLGQLAPELAAGFEVGVSVRSDVGVHRRIIDAPASSVLPRSRPRDADRSRRSARGLV
jgi:hypothetical protein